MGGAPIPKWDPKTVLTHSHVSPPPAPCPLRPAPVALEAQQPARSAVAPPNREPRERREPKSVQAVVVKTVLGSHFGIGEFTIHFRTCFGGWIESDVHWGYDLDVDPWPGFLRKTWKARTKHPGQSMSKGNWAMPSQPNGQRMRAKRTAYSAF